MTTEAVARYGISSRMESRLLQRTPEYARPYGLHARASCFGVSRS